jgi:hypothetical protein
LAPATADSPRHGASNAAPGSNDRDWFAMDLAGVLDILVTTTGGLSDEEAAARLAHYGPNTLPRREPPSLFEIVLRQFRSPLIYLLGIAAGVSLVIGEVKDAAFIMGVLLINAIIGTVQECNSCCVFARRCAAVTGCSTSMRRHSCRATSSTSSPAIACRQTSA